MRDNVSIAIQKHALQKEGKKRKKKKAEGGK